MQLRKNDLISYITEMMRDEEREQLRIEKSALWAIVQRKDAELEQAQKANEDLREGLKQAIMAIEACESSRSATGQR